MRKTSIEAPPDLLRAVQRWSEAVDSDTRDVMAVSFEVATGSRAPAFVHRHRKSQLMYAVKGMLYCTTGEKVWSVPSGCAIWIPGWQYHGVFASGETKCHSIYLEPGKNVALPGHCCTVSVCALLGELIKRACTQQRAPDGDGPESRVLGVLLDEIARAPVEDLQLPMPKDSRLMKLVLILLNAPSQRDGTEAWAKAAALSKRSLSRLFLEETGMTLRQWRHRLHALIAVGLLSNGQSVQTAAFELGYANSSSFIKMFRGVLGYPPARFVAKSRREEAEPVFFSE
ncbi:helix-turn-helix domain-containing protein [Duganella sp. FT50W]|uniref:Helix-turn-helix domain-containing protein n=1 Tax=Duganella lactea TaxID=2692173 RepID=A0A6L8ML31_9BURK|nr:helix-turn-helix transcriptional regulator [Duganella lactea]MYM83329.1 helix-turn-helix domain-containing protein [Duganella lactea]